MVGDTIIISKRPESRSKSIPQSVKKEFDVNHLYFYTIFVHIYTG